MVGITSLVAVIMAYVYRAGAPAWALSHYQFQIRTFWIGLLYAAIGIVLAMVIIGWAVLLLTVIWLIVRCVKGMRFAADGQPYPDATTWLW